MRLTAEDRSNALVHLDWNSITGSKRNIIGRTKNSKSIPEKYHNTSLTWDTFLIIL